MTPEPTLSVRALEAISQGLLITDHQQPDEPIVYASPGFEQITGYSAAEVIGRNCRFLQGKATDLAAVARLREAIRAERAHNELFLNYRRDGSPFWNELSLSPLRDDAGRVTHFVGVQQDVTARREFEEQRLQTKKLETVGLFAGGLAHDFNNLLTVITGFSWMLLESIPPGDPLRNSVEEIKKAGDRATALTRQLLSFSRKQMRSPQRLDLNALVRDLVPAIQRTLGDTILLETNFEPRLDPILADPSQIEPLVMHLVTNARDAMPTGGTLTITTANVSPADGPHVRLSVRDTGVGMNDELRSHIFEPFFTTKDEGQGAGLGLSVAHGIVRQSRGRIEVESAPQAGSCFHVHLPSAAATPTQPSAAPNNPPAKPAETILLAEDSDVIRKLALTALQRAGYSVLAAADAEDALRMAAARPEPIDLLVTDVLMPGMDGRQLAERLLQLRPGLKVLYLSGHTDDDLIRRDVLSGQVGYLQKPFTPASLSRMVRQTLDATK